MSQKPSTLQKLVVRKLTSNFREAVSVETVKLCQPQENEVCVRNRYVGINASDVNFSAGRYFEQSSPPFDIGFEAIGEIFAVGSKVENFKIGQSVGYLFAKAFSEYVCVAATDIFPIPEIKPEYLGLLVTGLTASIGLDKAGRITEGETVLVTAAAGGTGQIAVQWAKAAGCHVIGTCSSDAKCKFLKGLGCDRVINYIKEDISDVLTKEYPKGVNVVWETIGGKVFDTCASHLAKKGRLLIIGGITGYKSDKKEALPKVEFSSLPEMLLFKSAAIQGFLLLDFVECFPTYYKYLVERYLNGEIKVQLDNGKKTTGEEFVGMEGIIRGVEHLHTGKNLGKVIARVY